MATPSSSIVAENVTDSNASEKGSEFMKNLEKLGSFTLGNTNSNEKNTEKTTENLGTYIFKPFDSIEILSEKTVRKGGVIDFPPLNTKEKLPEASSGNLGRSTFGLRNSYGLRGKPFEILENFNSGPNDDLISEEFSDIQSENFNPFDLFSTSDEEIQVPSSGTPLQFKPTFNVETARVVKTIATIHQCITGMKEYSGKSLEELRLEDYKDNRKGKKSVNSTLHSEGFFVPNTTTTAEIGGFDIPNSTTTSQIEGSSDLNSTTASHVEEFSVLNSTTTSQTGGLLFPNLTTSSKTGGFSIPNSATTSQTGNYFNPISTIESHTGGNFFKFSNEFSNIDTRLSDLKFDERRTSGVSKLLEGLQQLLITGKHSDVTLCVQNKEFNVHKNILSVLSPVFSAMMENKTKENSPRVLNIDDCDAATFSDFLHFLYTGNTRKLNEDNVLNLYKVANEYKVQELSKICINYMKNNITFQNFYDILAFSLRHNETDLMKMTTQFFDNHSTEITTTENWESFLKENPDKANDLLLKTHRQLLNTFQQSEPTPPDDKETKESLLKDSK